MKRRLLGMLARNADLVLFFCGCCLIALPFPTIGFGVIDAWYAARGEVVQGRVLETRVESRTTYTSETTQTVYIADVELLSTGTRVELEGINLYDGIVRRGDIIDIEVAGRLFRPRLEDDRQYGVWIMTGTVWLLALAVGVPIWKAQKGLEERGELEAAKSW
ncbi:MAG: hypothetical protein AAGK22_24830 [Acidobacteriota bacterium]